MRENSHFIRGTDVSRHEPTLIGGVPSVESYHSLIGRLESLVGRDAAALFAEPVLPSGMTGASTTISWYCARDGGVVEFETIDEIARKPIIEKLAARLVALEPALRDPEVGPALGTWLNIFDPADILSVGGEPVLVDWGFLPAGIGADLTARENHFARTLGRFAPTLKLPPVEAPRPAPVSDEASRRTKEDTTPIMPTSIPEPAPGSQPPPPQPPGPTPPPGPVPVARPWLAPLVASALAALTLIVLLLPGVLKFPSGDSAQREADALQRLHTVNESLEAQLTALQDVGRDRVCRVGDPVIQVPDPSKPGAPPVNMEVLPRPPEQVPLPPGPANNGKDTDKANVGSLLDAATVLVFSVTPSGEGTVQGTGFFVNDHNIVTNRHVIEESDPEKIFVASRALGGIRHARLVTRSASPQNKNEFDIDLAVLELAPGASQVSLPIGATPEKLSTVYIAGFPNFVIVADVTFQNFLHKLSESLKEGDVDAALQRQGQVSVPSPDLRYGRVNNVIRAGSEELQLILHDMQIAPGHSGGPLVDSCGRVDGVNTWDLKNKSGPQLTSVAQDASILTRFLKDKNIDFKSDSTACVSSPSIAQAPPTPPAPPSPPPPAPK
jgi:hypothetical protein